MPKTGRLHPVQMRRYLEKLGAKLNELQERLTITLCGSTAAILQGWMEPRHSDDCDALAVEPEGVSHSLMRLARTVVEDSGHEEWFNFDASEWTSNFPEGWRERTIPLPVEAQRNLGNLEIKTLCRKDFVAAKFLRASRDDREDILKMRITREEYDYAASNLRRHHNDDIARSPALRMFLESLAEDVRIRER